MKMNKFSNINTFMGMENPYDKSDIVVMEQDLMELHLIDLELDLQVVL